MNWLQRFLGRAPLGRPGPEMLEHLVRTEIASTVGSMTSAVELAMQARDVHLGVAEHSARVAVIADRIAERLGFSEADRYTLQLAARLHELGMYAVPAELLQRRAPLSAEELRKVRAQAGISAQVARLVHPPRVARLIEHQYADFRELAETGPMDERDLLLAGILRVADVIAAVTWPRPYQDPMPAEFRDELLEGGAGERFHPVAVDHALKLELSP